MKSTDESGVPGSPYCGECGFDLAGLTDSARCPECGKPLVEVLQRRGQLAANAGARRFESESRLFGLPVVSVALGPRPDLGERRGVAKGIIAVGDVAIGGVAIGGVTIGVAGAGGVAIGGGVTGGLAVGAIAGLGGLATGALASGGGAAGGLVVGGLAVGYTALGGMAIGVHAAGGVAHGSHTITSVQRDPIAEQAFRETTWFFGSQPIANAQAGLVQPSLVVIAAILAVSMPILLAAFLAWKSRGSSANPFSPDGAP